jgi:hypothetical protein
MARKRAKATTPSKNKLKEAVLLIPLTYNDGTEVSRDVLDSILDEVYLVFAGWTIEGVVKGAYQMTSGEKRVEELLKIAVVMTDNQVAEFEAMVARWAALLDQEVILVKISDFVVKLIPPEAKENQT